MPRRFQHLRTVLTKLTDRLGESASAQTCGVLKLCAWSDLLLYGQRSC